MASNRLIEAQIVAALACVRAARFDGDIDIIEGAERHLDHLLDQLCEAVPA